MQAIRPNPFSSLPIHRPAFQGWFGGLARRMRSQTGDSDTLDLQIKVGHPIPCPPPDDIAARINLGETVEVHPSELAAEVKLGDTTDERIEANRFIDQWMPEIEKTQRFTRFSRQQVIQAVGEYTGLRILDVGNVTDLELSWVLKRLALNPETVPLETNTVVIGHGLGQGRHWSFVGSGQKVADYIAQHVPQGEKVWAVVCDADRERYFHLAEGKLVTSGT